MTVTVLIAHAQGEDHLAAELATPLEAAGYVAHHAGQVVVGDSVIGEQQKWLNAGAPVVLCGTIRAMGTPWARRVVRAAQAANQHVRIFAVQMEEDADTEGIAFDGKVARWWQNREKAAADLLAALRRYHPLDAKQAAHSLAATAEEHYRRLALESCDLVDLINLPEGDRHLATRQLELRRLYVPLRVGPIRAREGPPDSLSEILRVLEWRRPQHPRMVDEDAGGRQAVGEALRRSRRLVVLGDPGAGKSTLLRWLVTAYLLRLADDPDLTELPDIQSLPAEDWLPVLIRCRDLPAESIEGSLDDILRRTLRLQEMTEAENTSLRELFRARLTNGTALLLIDGLDEIADPRGRTRLCEQIERVARAYPRAAIVITSRIVGYREIGRRLGRCFDHLQVALLSWEDRYDFVRRWCALTEPPERRESAVDELISDVHSTPRIEALTSNPMLLTTMALVKRKVGKLPSRRAELYWEAVQVLLNWRREVDLPLDAREALPQLEYIAYAMCDRGVQRLRQDEILLLLERMRTEYPHIHAARARTPEQFLRLLESRTGLVAETGEVRHHGRPIPVYEFRHLTFQEYLAARALVEGHLPGHDPSVSLADRIGPLAGRTRDRLNLTSGTASWAEPIRLTIASCNDRDVDNALRAVLTRCDGEHAGTERARVRLAAKCLSDEPNASEKLARSVLTSVVSLVAELDDAEGLRLDVLPDLYQSRWRDELLARVAAACDGSWADADLLRPELYGLTREIGPDSGLDPGLARSVALVRKGGPGALRGALELLAMAFRERYRVPTTAFSGAVEALGEAMDGVRPLPMMASWALCWIYDTDRPHHEPPPPWLVDKLIERLGQADTDSAVVRFLMWIVREPQNIPHERLPVLTNAIFDRFSRAHNVERQEVFDILQSGPYPDLAGVFRLILRKGDPDQPGWARANVGLLAELPADIFGILVGDENVDRAALLWAAFRSAWSRPGEKLVEPVHCLVRESLDHDDPDVRLAAVAAAAALGDPRGRAALGRLLNSGHNVVDLGHLISHLPDRRDRVLLAIHLDRVRPREVRGGITRGDVGRVVAKRGMAEAAVRARYERLAQLLPLQLEWQRPTD
jgi:hypothetical protein